jgi:NADPH-dependent glutamate synthase beta subunit-like oxidoreductase
MAVAIDEVKKFIAMQDLNAETRFIPKKVIPKSQGGFDEKIAIIGAGPAGLSCAFYLAEKGYRPTIFEKNEKPGGMLTYGIPSFKLEKDVIQAEIDVIKEYGVDIKCGVEVGKDVTLDELRAQGYKAFYVAIGCQGGKKTGVPGEDAEGVTTAVEFLREVGANEKYDIKGDVVVIGGGNVAIDAARSSVKVGAPKVSMFCLESRDIMPASDDEVAEAEEDGIQINCGWGPKEILTENGEVCGIVLKKCTRVYDENKRFAPEYDENDTVTVECKHIVLSVGQSILWGDLLKGSKVELGRGNGAVADPLTYQTAEPDIFVGGDVYTGPKFAIDAIAAGKEGALSIHRFVRPGSDLKLARTRKNEFIELNKEDIKVESYDNSKRQIPGVDLSKAGARSFRDPKLIFTEEQVKAETARCLECGASFVDENQCIGCGVCTTKCEFDAIHLTRDNPECSTMRRSEDKIKYVLGNGIKQGIKLKFKGKK